MVGFMLDGVARLFVHIIFVYASQYLVNIFTFLALRGQN